MSAKYDRHIEIFNFLGRGGRYTYARLSDIFEVSVKTIKKDIGELAYFFPIDTFQGRCGGVEMRKGYAINGCIMKKNDLEIIFEALSLLTETKDDPEIQKLIKMMEPKK